MSKKKAYVGIRLSISRRNITVTLDAYDQWNYSARSIDLVWFYGQDYVSHRPNINMSYISTIDDVNCLSTLARKAIKTVEEHRLPYDAIKALMKWATEMVKDHRVGYHIPRDQVKPAHYKRWIVDFDAFPEDRRQFIQYNYPIFSVAEDELSARTGLITCLASPEDSINEYERERYADFLKEWGTLGFPMKLDPDEQEAPELGDTILEQLEKGGFGYDYRREE